MMAERKFAEARNCFLSLGANLGERGRTLRKALERIASLAGVELCGVSSFYETEPWGRKDQPNFLNMAAHIRTTLAPMDLLHAMQSIERELGRVRKEHWGARTIDIDFLAMEGVCMESEQLTLPHPYWKERAFVLVPLAEIAGNLAIEGRTVKEQLADCKDRGTVARASGSPKDFCLRIVACVDEHWGLGRDGSLLFHFAEDMRFFREITMGHTVILGRKTLESLPGGKPLEGRRHLVLSRNPDFMAWGEEPSLHVVSGLEDVWNYLRQEETNFVIGGAEVYRQFLPYSEEAFITFVGADGQADCFLPDLDERKEFALCSSRCAKASDVQMEFRCYRRVPFGTASSSV